MFANGTTYHTTLQEYPMEILFGQDGILNIKHVADLEQIQQHKQELIICNNKREYMHRNSHKKSW